MTEPSDLARFLKTAGYDNWSLNWLAGDASSRRYARLIGPRGATVILMDAGPDAQTQVPPFLRIDTHLMDIGLCPPKVLALEESNRFLLLEDLGNDDLATWLLHQPEDESRLYFTAIDVLLAVSQHAPPKGLSALSPEVASVMIDPLFEWYLPQVPEALRREVRAALQTSFAALSGEPTCLALRDFHAQNLIWRPQKGGTDRIGILDFQDAFLAAPEYDLVSLLRDARRDVSPDVCAEMIRRFAAGSGKTVDQVTSACAILGVQRNLRILGIFARLAQRDGKVHYRTLMPRVIRHLRLDLSHPELGDLSRIMSPLLQDGAI